jgi:hypothetical protein
MDSGIVSVFFWLAGFQLARLLIEDLKTKKVDERTSSFMQGIVVFLYLLTGRAIEGVIVLIVSVFGLVFIKQKIELIGLNDGDITILSWVLPGIWFFGAIPTAIFLIGTYGSFTLFGKQSKPFTPFITVGFIMAWAITTATLI